MTGAGASQGGAVLDQLIGANAESGSTLVSGIEKGAGELASFTKSAIEGAAERERAEYRVAAALKMIGQYTDENYAQAVAFAGQLANETILTRDQALAVEALGIQLGRLSGAPLEDMTKAAVGWAELMQVGADEAIRRMILAARPGGEDERRMFEPYMAQGTALNRMTPGDTSAALLAGGLQGFALVQSQMLGLARDIQQTRGAWQNLKDELGADIYEGAALGLVLTELKDTSQEVGRYTRLLADVLSSTIGALEILGRGAYAAVKTIGLGVVYAGAGAMEMLGRAANWASGQEPTRYQPWMGAQEMRQGLGMEIASVWRGEATMTRRLLMSHDAVRRQEEATEATLRLSGKTEQEIAELMRAHGMHYPNRTRFLDVPGPPANSQAALSAQAAAGVRALSTPIGIGPEGRVSGGLPVGAVVTPAGAMGAGLDVASPQDRAADALETYLPIIAENTRKEPPAPYQVNP